MGIPLRVLIIEDSEDDAVLLLSELRRGGYEPVFELVETPAAMSSALQKGRWDIVVSDYILPEFSGLAALALLMESGLDLPFIIVSGNIGEDIAVEAMKAGAHDYIIKGSLKRLVPAVERELREAEVRRERRLAEEQIFRLNRLYAVLSKVNEAIVRIGEPANLYERVCRIAVEDGQFKMAWVGLIEPDTRRISPVASFADTGGYLDCIDIYAKDVPEGKGPTGTAINEGRMMICSDVEYDPIMLPWRDRALRHGFRSSAAFPIRSGSEVIGAFTLYADTPQFFTNVEISLLSSLTDDISYAIGSMAAEKMRLEAEAALQKSAEEIQDLYNNAPCGYHSLDEEGVFVRINDTELRWLGYSREEVVRTLKLSDLLTPESVKTFQISYPLFKKRGWIGELEMDMVCKDGTVLPVLVNATSIYDKDGNYVMSRSTIYDITERKEAEKRRHITNTILNLFVQKISRKEYLDAVVRLIQEWNKCNCVGIRVLDVKGNIPYESYVGFDEEFLDSENFLSTIHDQCSCIRVITGTSEPQELPAMTPHGSFCSNNTPAFMTRMSEGEKSRFRLVCMRQGFRSVAIIPISYHGQVLGLIHCADKTEGRFSLKDIELIEVLSSMVGEAIYRFNAEEDLRKSQDELRSLTAHLQEVREAERTSIAREIHDELGQIITALKMDLSWIKNNYKDHGALFNKSKSMLALVDSTIQTIQNIISELRPSILDVLGIFAAIEWQAEEFRKRTGVPCKIVMPSDEMAIGDHISINLFRIVQEIFTNIIRYAEASSVSLSLQNVNNQLFLNVSDNGIGITEKQLSSPSSFGLIGMRERVLSMGGDIRIAGRPDEGTSITIIIPLYQDHHAA